MSLLRLLRDESRAPCARAHALLASVGLVGVLSAQELQPPDAFQITDDAAPVRVEASFSGGCAQGVGLGWARIDAQALDARPHELTVRITSPGYIRNGAVESRRSFTLGVGATARWFLPVSVPPESAQVQVVVDGESYVDRINFRRGRGHVCLFVSDVAGAAPLAAAVLEGLPTETPGRPPQLHAAGSDGVPADWRLYTSFSVVLVDGRAPLTRAVQDALRRYAFAGGRVVVATPRGLPNGSLKGAVAELFGTRPLGLGQVAAIGSLSSDRARARQALAGLRPLGQGVWPAPSALFEEQRIEGLGRPPMSAFLAIILMFAVLAGPVNYTVLRRRKRPMLALLTVPALGFVTTAVILAYGILHDGFGVRGVHRSWTLLDQAAREGAAISARTLFAGLTPSDLAMGRESLLLSARASLGERGMPDRWRLESDADGGLLDGGLLPSRIITPLVSAQQGPMSERLIVRRVGGTCEVAPESDLRLLGVSVLRDPQGDYWLGVDGRFRRAEAADGEQMFAELRSAACQIAVGDEDEHAMTVLPSVLPEWGGPGSYAARVQAAPWLDEHGFAVDYDGREHWVFGRLAREDFVR